MRASRKREKKRNADKSKGAATYTCGKEAVFVNAAHRACRNLQISPIVAPAPHVTVMFSASISSILFRYAVWIKVPSGTHD